MDLLEVARNAPETNLEGGGCWLFSRDGMAASLGRSGRRGGALDGGRRVAPTRERGSPQLHVGTDASQFKASGISLPRVRKLTLRRAASIS